GIRRRESVRGAPAASPGGGGRPVARGRAAPAPAARVPVRLHRTHWLDAPREAGRGACSWQSGLSGGGLHARLAPQRCRRGSRTAFGQGLRLVTTLPQAAQTIPAAV